MKYSHYCSKDFILEGKPMATYRRRSNEIPLDAPRGLLTPLIKGLKWFRREITKPNPEME